MTIVSLYSELDDLGGGQFRQMQSLKPIAYLQNGTYKRIGFALGDSGDPSLTVGANEFVDVRMRPKLAGASPVIHFGRGQSMVRTTPLNTNNVDGAALGTNGFLYSEAWNNVDLKLTYGGHFLRKDIILRAGHPASFAFRVDSHVGLNSETLATPDFYIPNPFLEKAGELSIPLTWQKSTQGGKLILTINLPEGDWTGWTLDPTFTAQPDAAAGKDNILQGGASVTYNEGTTTAWSWVTGQNTSVLFLFSLSSIPAAAICTSAVFSMFRAADSLTGSRTARLNRLLSANGGWVEGTKAHALAGAGESCYNAKAADGAGGVTTAWAGGAGCLTSGTDYEADLLSSLLLPAGSIPAGTEEQFSLDSAKVKDWFGADTNNFGFREWLDSGVNNGSWATSDHATAGYRPKLVVDYTLPVSGDAPFARAFNSPFRGAFG